MSSSPRLSRLSLATLAVLLALVPARTARAHVELGADLSAAQEVPTPFLFTASLDSAQETPAPTVGSPLPTGTAKFALNADRTIRYEFTTDDLTGPAALAHLHQGDPGVAGGIVVSLDVSGSGTTAALTEAQVTALRGGGLYINVHTAQNPLGEIRGQIGALAEPSATATFEFDDVARTLQYSIVASNLTGAVNAAHLHMGVPGTAGGIEVPLDLSLSGTATDLTQAQINLLYDGLLYVNIHTDLNGLGEIRGQLLNEGTPACTCGTGARKGKDYKRCVAAAIKALERAERKTAPVKALKRAIKLTACGKTRFGRRTVACCLPQTPTEDIVIGRICAQIPSRACTKKGGTVAPDTGATCFPDNPCTPPASPSGAFIDDATTP
jgi:hypothetical protein